MTLALKRKRGPGNRSERPKADNGIFSDEETEFVMAVDEFKRENKCPFPRLTDYLFILKLLGSM